MGSGFLHYISYMRGWMANEHYAIGMERLGRLDSPIQSGGLDRCVALGKLLALFSFFKNGAFEGGGGRPV